MLKKLKIDEMYYIAQKRGGKCLSDEYKHSKAKLLWECPEGHRWEATPCNIKRGQWCPICAVNNLRCSLIDIQKLAKKRGGHCLSEKHINGHTKLLWECSEGHQWEATPASIKSGCWCPFCAGNIRHTIQKIQDIAKEKGVRCLSKTYVNTDTKLLWECDNGHQWETTPYQLKNGLGCPKCTRKKIAKKQRSTIEEMQKFAEKQGGYCRSNKYTNSFTALLWECSKGHQWETLPAYVKQGNWCPVCAGNIVLTIEEMQKVAKERGGKCLSKKYINDATKLLWECSEGHQWEANPNKIRQGRWCPHCSASLGERICREIFEQIFNKKFPKSFPKWLLNKAGNQMELDGYCKQLGIAFEHQGLQHFDLSTHFIKDEQKLNKRKVDDLIKKTLCIKHNVKLIEIKEIQQPVIIDDIKQNIIKQCKLTGISLPNNIHTISIDLNKAYRTSNLDDLRRLAIQRGGKCLSNVYKGSNEPIEWECSEGHRWKATPTAVKSGNWCRPCSYKQRANQKRLNIDEMHKVAEERDGRCLSKEYIGTHIKLLWECSEGHQWEAVPSSIKRGHWCPICAIEKRAIKRRLNIY